MKEYRLFDDNYEYEPLFNLGAPIIPGESIGGFALGKNIGEMRSWVAWNEFISNEENLEATLLNPLFVEYSVYGGAIAFVVFIATGEISLMSAASGYRGKLHKVIGPGDTFSKLVGLDDSLRFYHDNIISMKTPGLLVETPAEFEDLDASTPYELPDFQMRKISVYNKLYS